MRRLACGLLLAFGAVVCHTFGHVALASVNLYQYEKTVVYQQIKNLALKGQLQESLNYLQAHKNGLTSNQHQLYLSFILELAGDYEAAFESFKKIKVSTEDESYEAHFKRLRALNVYAQSKQLLLFSSGEIFYQDPLQAILAADIKDYLERRSSLPRDDLQIHIISSAKLFSLMANRFLLEQGVPILGLLIQDAFIFKNRIYLKDPALTNFRMPWSFILEVALNDLASQKQAGKAEEKNFETITRNFCTNLQSIGLKQTEYQNIWRQKAWLRLAVLAEIKGQFGFQEPKPLNINTLFNTTMESLAWREYLFQALNSHDCKTISVLGFRSFLDHLQIPQIADSINASAGASGVFGDFFKYAFLSGKPNETNLLFERRFQNPLIRQIYLMNLLQQEGHTESAQIYFKKLGPFQKLPEVVAMMSGLSAKNTEPAEWTAAAKQIAAGKVDQKLENDLRYWCLVDPYQLKPRQLWFDFLQKKIPLVTKDPGIENTAKKKWIKDLHMTKQKVYYLETHEISNNM